jgi:hypothetical protein
LLYAEERLKAYRLSMVYRIDRIEVLNGGLTFTRIHDSDAAPTTLRTTRMRRSRRRLTICGIGGRAASFIERRARIAWCQCLGKQLRTGG